MPPPSSYPPPPAQPSSHPTPLHCSNFSLASAPRMRSGTVATSATIFGLNLNVSRQTHVQPFSTPFSPRPWHSSLSSGSASAAGPRDPLLLPLPTAPATALAQYSLSLQQFQCFACQFRLLPAPHLPLLS